MIRIDFHVNAVDKAHYACRLIRKALTRNGMKAIVVGDEAMLAQIDEALWQFSPTEFIAHCRGDAPAAVRDRSPVILASTAQGHAPAYRALLVNLGTAMPECFEDFERVIEVVGSDDEDRSAGRARWRHYQQRGHLPHTEDLARRGAA